MVVDSSNIDVQIKLIDFGLARSYDEALKGQKKVTVMRNQKEQSFDINEVGDILQTPGYAPPEVLLEVFRSPASDLWSVGVTVAELILGKPLYATSTHGTSVYAQLAAICAFLNEKTYSDKSFVNDSPVVRDYFQKVHVPNEPSVDGSDWRLLEPEDLSDKFAEDADRAAALSPSLEWANVGDIFPSTKSNVSNSLLRDLLGQILLFYPEKRISVEEACEHPFFGSSIAPLCQ